MCEREKILEELHNSVLDAKRRQRFSGDPDERIEIFGYIQGLREAIDLLYASKLGVEDAKT